MKKQLLCLCLICLAGTANADTWSTQIELASSSQEYVSVVYDTTNAKKGIAAWVQSSDVKVSIYDTTSDTWGSVTSFPFTGGASLMTPSVDMIYTGGSLYAIVAWLDSGSNTLSYAVYSSGAWGSKQTFASNPIPTAGAIVRVAIDYDGHAFFAYTAGTISDSSPTSIRALVSSDVAGGSSWPTFGGAITISATGLTNASSLQLGTHKAVTGNFAVASWWQDIYGDSDGIYANVYTGSWTGPIDLQDSSGGVTALHSVTSLAIDPAVNAAAVAWCQQDASSTDEQVVVAYRGTAGQWSVNAASTWTLDGAASTNSGSPIFGPGLYTYNDTIYASYTTIDTGTGDPTGGAISVNTVTYTGDYPIFNSSSIISSLNGDTPVTTTISGDESGNFMTVWMNTDNIAKGQYVAAGTPQTALTITESSIVTAFLATNLAAGPDSLAILSESGELYSSYYPYSASPPPPTPPPPGSLLPPSGLNGKYAVNKLPLQAQYYNELSWTASASAGVLGYHIYRDEVLIGSTSNNSYVDQSITRQSTYTYEVTAYDGGSESDAVSVTVGP